VAPLPALATGRGAEPAEREDDPAEREIEATMAAADESHDRPVPVASPPGAAPSSDDVQRLFAGLTARRTPHGGLLIEAPPETASTLAALLAGMAQLLQGVAGEREVR
jgi:hypothetical protein